ncbi:MAG: uracil-DNA glycosylase [Nitrosomonas sp.]|nr:uracil-DNA glycosylase [Nitrosomonas sp.]
MKTSLSFQPDCRRCPRLAQYLDEVKSAYPDYHARPVPAFGADQARFLIIGLAPGLHGANRTGRPFTGDFAGILFYRTLYKFAFASCSESIAPDDGLTLSDCRITNSVKCLPPENKPDTSEIRECNNYLKAELAEFMEQGGKAVLALGNIAHRATLMALGIKLAVFPFKHGAAHQISNNLRLYDSYHCSRYNTQTRRLTTEMFEQVFARIREDLA